jgi:hypothetical protein
MTSVFVESKRTDKVDFVKPLRRHILSEHGKESAEQYEKALEDLSAVREDLRLNTERTESAREKFLQYEADSWTHCILSYTCRYEALLGAAEKHFPIGESGIRINFYWYDSFTKKRSCKYYLSITTALLILQIAQYGMDFERAGLHFNLGAIETQIAVLHNRSTDEGVKMACKYFQMAAGTFSALGEVTQSQPHLAGTPDLHHEYLSMLSFLMLGQAQECFFQKAQKGGMKPAILFKLAAQVYDYYDRAGALMESTNIKSSVPTVWHTVS